jgi:pimeloyl-ACP methyl ester carboxylesterase
MTRLMRGSGKLTPGNDNHDADGDASLEHKDGRRNLSGTAWLGLAALGASYLFVRGKARQAEREFSPSGKFVVADGVRLRYVEQGQGPVLVLLHGNGTMAEDFGLSGLTGQLARNFHVIAFDRPGFGYSERPRRRIWTPMAQGKLLHKALHMLGIEQAIVLGHSWGTLVALAMALEFPAFVRGLVLLSGYYYPSVRLDVALASGPAIPVLGDLMRYTVSPLLGRILWPFAIRRAFSPGRVTASFRRLPVWMALRPSQLRATAAEAVMMIPSAFALGKRYEELKMPVVIMAGEGDRVASAEHNSVRLHEALAQSELMLLPAAGHMVPHQAREKIVAALKRLAGIEEMPASEPPSGQAGDVTADAANAGGSAPVPKPRSRSKQRPSRSDRPDGGTAPR